MRAPNQTLGENGRRSTEVWGDGSYSADYYYSPLGELTDAGDSVSQYEYTYDQARRLQQETQTLEPLSGSTVDFIYEHDLLGNVTGIDNKLDDILDNSIDFLYDNRNRVKMVSQTGGCRSGNRHGTGRRTTASA